ncbi:NACHT, LRR and PYD domains-containing protein 14-like isoform X2 [Anguilla anguilla]|uniref:NACHT, LRR and PYD domains-containing protein 14-like isoform X2 n=1 Tax=Anguilla anguilla TaxID=7936 RepID=UPI0015AD11DE|nr:NACHT, LRR and PYD domains-containing protein 14-like isoform X2 [Anguilla anguilla]
MSAPWDLVGTPLHRLHTLHRDAMAAYSLDPRPDSLFGGQCPREVLRSGRYVALDAGGGEDLDGAGVGDGERPQDAVTVVTAALAQSRVLRVAGSAGAGKSTALQKLLADWASGVRLTRFAFLFPLPLGELGSGTGQGGSGTGERSLADLLSQQHPHLSSTSMDLVFQKPQALLFVLDGLDQDQDQAPPCSDPNQPAPLSALVSGLLRGTLLPGASVLVTCRPPASLEPLSESEGGHVEVQGLSQEGRGAYLRLFFPDPREAAQVLEHMEETLGFCSLARLPGFCWTLCSVYREARAAGRALPKTLTHVFAQATASLFQRHAVGAEPAAALLTGLGKMAAGAVLSGAGSCSREEVAAFGLPPPQASAPLRDFLRPRSCSFLSPELAQFLLAVAYHRGCWDRGGLPDLLELAAGKADLLELFLAGLCDPSQRAPLEGAVGKFDSDRALELTAWLKEMTQEAVQSYHKERHLRAFRLLQQRQDAALAVAAVGPSARLGLSYGGLSVQDSAALSYMATCCGELEQLNLYCTKNLSEEVARRLLPAIIVAKKIILTQSSLCPGSYAPLTAGIQRGAVRELDLSYCPMGDRGAQSLCAGLVGSALQILRVPCCRLTEVSCGYLASALCSSQLHLLDLRGNDIKDAGLVQLSQSLRSPQCQLQELGLQMCKLTGMSMEALSSALCSGSSVLRSVDLRDNDLKDHGLACLCTALRDPHCPLQALCVMDCDLTDACCADLADSLQTAGRALTELDLSVNELGDAGVMQLIRTFRAADCAPQKLRLTRCELGGQTFRELAALLRTPGSRLKELEVGLNQVGDAGATHLWGALRDPACTLQHLDVEMVDLTDGCVAELCAAVRSSGLKSLVLKNNQLTDDVVPALVAMAKDSRTLRELNLQYNDFSEDVFELMDACGKIRY